MGINLIGSLLVRNDMDPLRVVLDQAGFKYPTGSTTVEFEYSDRIVFNEDYVNRTSIDLMISGETTRFFIEVKHKEPGFGGCKTFERGDCDGRNRSFLVGQS